MAAAPRWEPKTPDERSDYLYSLAKIRELALRYALAVDTRDIDTIAKLVKGLSGAPVNIVARPGVPAAAELERIGVRRVSIASGATLAVMSLVKSIGDELFKTRAFDGIGHAMTRPEAQKLFEPRD